MYFDQYFFFHSSSQIFPTSLPPASYYLSPKGKTSKIKEKTPICQKCPNKTKAHKNMKSILCWPTYSLEWDLPYRVVDILSDTPIEKTDFLLFPRDISCK